MADSASSNSCSKSSGSRVPMAASLVARRPLRNRALDGRQRADQRGRVCTLLAGVERPDPGRLLLGANRDESMTRLATSPQVLSTDPYVVGGRDTRAGGTWLAVRESRLVSAI